MWLVATGQTEKGRQGTGRSEARAGRTSGCVRKHMDIDRCTSGCIWSGCKWLVGGAR